VMTPRPAIRGPSDRSTATLRRYYRAAVGRFGYLRAVGNPRHLYQRLFVPPVFANGVPKCGTNLLREALRAFGVLIERPWSGYLDWPEERKSGAKAVLMAHLRGTGRACFRSGHMVPDMDLLGALRARRFRTFLIIRDPRDYAISYAHHILRREPHRLHSYFKSELGSTHQRVMAVIQGVSADHTEGAEIGLPPVDEMFEAFMPWFTEDLNMVVRFEELVGPNGGGSRDAQVATLTRMADHLGMRGTRERIPQSAARVFSKRSATFRRGQIGEWRSVFGEKERDVFKERTGRLLLDLGYERDMDW
jgi:hypothetical protein